MTDPTPHLQLFDIPDNILQALKNDNMYMDDLTELEIGDWEEWATEHNITITQSVHDAITDAIKAYNRSQLQSNSPQKLFEREKLYIDVNELNAMEAKITEALKFINFLSKKNDWDKIFKEVKDSFEKIHMIIDNVQRLRLDEIQSIKTSKQEIVDSLVKERKDLLTNINLCYTMYNKRCGGEYDEPHEQKNNPNDILDVDVDNEVLKMLHDECEQCHKRLIKTENSVNTVNILNDIVAFDVKLESKNNDNNLSRIENIINSSSAIGVLHQEISNISSFGDVSDVSDESNDSDDNENSNNNMNEKNHEQNEQSEAQNLYDDTDAAVQENNNSDIIDENGQVSNNNQNASVENEVKSEEKSDITEINDNYENVNKDENNGIEDQVHGDGVDSENNLEEFQWRKKVESVSNDNNENIHGRVVCDINAQNANNNSVHKSINNNDDELTDEKKNDDDRGGDKSEPLLVELEEVAYDMQLQQLLQDQYPNIANLWRYNPLGTLEILQTTKAVTFRSKSIKVNICHANLDPEVTWQEYKVLINKFWFQVNSDAWLKPARKFLTDELHKEHFNVIPFTPNEGEIVKRTIRFNKMGKYDINDKIVHWKADGYFDLTEYITDEDFFETQCESDCVTLRILEVTQSIARNVEALCNSNFETARKKADGMTTKGITWNNL